MPDHLEPFVLAPVLVERPWGGRRLERYGKPIVANAMIGESWEVADLPHHVAPTVADPQSRVASGPMAGASLADLIDRAAEALLGPIQPTPEGRFPLLVKLLDARENLSIQVHPPASYVALHPEARLKTESWYVMEAAPGAELYLDVADGVGLDDVAGAVASSNIVRLLRRISGVAGEFFHLPAGLIHALGAGLVVAEVQTPSDTTFRIYDWATEYNRAPRPLHAEAAIASVRIRPDDAAHLPAVVDPGARTLTSNEHYWIIEHGALGGNIRLDAAPGPRVVLVTAGAVAVGDLELTTGSTAVVPHSALDASLEVATSDTLLEVGVTA